MKNTMENSSFYTSTTEIASNATTSLKYFPGTPLIAIITICYFLGILGNVLALIFLYKKNTRPNNPKHKLMLKFLALNDLVAMSGMLLLMYTKLLFAPVEENIWYCRARVFWRVFGLGSGCVATVMAVERWLALTKPFFYQKHVTVVFIRRSIFYLWISAVVLACMPIFGFGLYYEYETKKCVRYKTAKKPLDVVYAYIYFIIGMILCSCIVFCNIAVMRSLCYKGSKSIKEPVFMRRVSRNNSKISTASTREELAFGRLMAFLCIIFIICWLPQLLSIPLAQFDAFGQQKKSKTFYITADVLMALHFLLDPYVYVLQRLPTFRKLFCKNSKYRPQYSNSSIRTPSSEQNFYIRR